MKIAMVTSEANPFVKSGGLADVTFSLSKELVILGQEVILFMPLYKQISLKYEKDLQFIAKFQIHMSWRSQQVQIFRAYVDGIVYYFLQNDYYFFRDNIYGYDDDTERFAFFTLSVKEAFKVLNFKADIVHLHDWQPGLLPTLIKEQEKNNPFFKNFKFILTIHNPAFKGLFDKYFLGNLYSLPDYLFDNGEVRYENSVSSLKAAIMSSNKITTVSYTHRDELLDPYSEHGLSSVLELRRDDFVGILNGLDYEEFNPSENPYLPHLYDRLTVTSGKSLNKKALLEKFHLPLSDKPVFGLVSRLTWQKGISLILSRARSLIRQGGVLIILGSGEYELEQQIEHLRRDFPQDVGIYIGYNNELAHLIYAGSDFFLMPSLFEPCGIGQMIAQRYGTLPIVRYTGGLRDTVIGYENENTINANGIGFIHFNEGAMQYGLDLALKIYENKKLLLKLRRNAMKLDRTWFLSAESYLHLYRETIKE